MRLPLVFVYTISGPMCSREPQLPSYIVHSLEQARHSQPDADIVMISNFGECAGVAESMQDMPYVQRIDSKAIQSTRTGEFIARCGDIFQKDGAGELWMTSAIRFFTMEDYMQTYKVPELLHVEADNLLFGNITNLLPTLRTSYSGLAATPLNADKSFVTASVFWVSNVVALNQFTTLLLKLALNEGGEYKQYLKWLRPYACCRPGGLDPDEHGNGIKPFAVNEMSMLAYYRFREPKQFHMLPVVPPYKYEHNRHTIDMSRYQPGGVEVGADTNGGIWDPNSWGQFLGGTHNRGGRNKGFIDGTHVIGQAINMNRGANNLNFNISMHCASREQSRSYDVAMMAKKTESATTTTTTRARSMQCVTAPFVRFGEKSPWTPIWNLHIHSKHTHHHHSELCDCSE